MEHEARTMAREGVTLVALRLHNDEAGARRVRVTNELEGEVWPPRTNGIPDAGWDDAGYVGVVAGNETLALGYATPGAPRTPAVRVAATPTDDPVRDPETLDPVRGLPDPRPPRDALPRSRPSPVDSWLDDVERRLDRERVGNGDRRALARAARLHERCRR